MYCYIKEFDLLREVLFALQGLNGRIIRQDADGRFTITKNHLGIIDPTQRMLLEKLTSFGWLVNKIKNYINTVNKDPDQGKVSQCLAAALNNELLEYYHMVTQIEQQLQKCANQDNGRTRASTPTSELYGCVEVRPPKTSATYESLHTALTANGYNNGHQNQLLVHPNNHNPHHANSDDGFGSQVYSAPSSNASPTIPAVTLHQIHVWSLDHYFRLKTLAMLVECCKGERGGALARIVYRFMQQGDKQIKAIITKILSQVALPIRHMLSQWIFHGEIQDPYDEFFICVDDAITDGLTSSVTMMSIANVTTTQRGHHLPLSTSMNSLTPADERHYIIRDLMMPGFISRQQANKILATGKAVHLLKKVCTDSIAISVPGYDDLKKSFESTNIESLFRSTEFLNYGEENEFEYLLNTAHKEVGRKALEFLFGNYKLKSHFKGLRQYLLLGQGDFIRHLMDLLGTELDKRTSECRFLNIFSVLECAMRSTNAQFDDPDVTSRLDCQLLEPTTQQATGWDIFTLIYKVDGPISTIFTEERMRDYVDIFRKLWRIKRMEHVITTLWSNQMFYSKKVTHTMPSAAKCLHMANILLVSMKHLMQTIQNFIMFEVVECSWVELVAATNVAKDVEEVIEAHESYLKKIKSTMCQKDTLFDCVWEFQHLMTSLWLDIDSSSNQPSYQDTFTGYSLKIQTLTEKFQAHRLTCF